MPKLNWNSFRTQNEVLSAIESKLQTSGRSLAGVQKFLSEEGAQVACNQSLTSLFTSIPVEAESGSVAFWSLEFNFLGGELNLLEIKKVTGHIVK